jgi:menaquinone-dependent protoporphyrinogen IX oxidase
VATRVLVAYATSSGCDSNCAVDIANEIANVPELEVDVQPIGGVGSIDAYSAVYLGWGHPSVPGDREVQRFLSAHATLLPSRPVWIVHRHPGCVRDSQRGAMKLTRLVTTPAS